MTCEAASPVGNTATGSKRKTTSAVPALRTVSRDLDILVCPTGKKRTVCDPNGRLGGSFPGWSLAVGEPKQASNFEQRELRVQQK